MSLNFKELEDKFNYTGYEDFDPKSYDGITQNLWDLPIEEWNPQIIGFLLNLNKRLNELEYSIKELKQSLEEKNENPL